MLLPDNDVIRAVVPCGGATVGRDWETGLEPVVMGCQLGPGGTKVLERALEKDKTTGVGSREGLFQLVLSGCREGSR